MNENENNSFVTVDTDDTKLTNSISFAKVMLYFGAGLLITSLVAFLYPYLMMLLPAASRGNVYLGSIIGSAVILIVLAIASHFVFRTENTKALVAFYSLYTIIMGVLLSSVFLTYEVSDVVYSLGITSVAFLIMAVVGIIAKDKLNHFAIIGIGLVFACLVASIINFFFFNETVYWIISLVMIFVIMMYVAFDFGRVVKACQNGQLQQSKALSLFLAFNLYLDFINLFLYILRIVAASKRK